MSIVFLNNEFVAPENALISPMDRGFLFGEGIYEVIPCYRNKFIGLQAHLNRLSDGLNALDIKSPYSDDKWQSLCHQLIEQNNGDNLAIYIQVTRGSSPVRHHAFNQDSTPTIYAFTFEIPTAPIAEKKQAGAYKVSTHQDLRWQRCHIKSTSLLGNVLHFQHGINEGNKETILFNKNNELTEASASNVFVVKNNTIITPPLDHQILPGITRHILLDILRKHSNYIVQERRVTHHEVLNADEVWLTSSTKEVAPVIAIDNTPVASGKVGDIWLAAQTLFSQYKNQY